MTGTALLGLALFAAPYSIALWAWSLATRDALHARTAPPVEVVPPVVPETATVTVGAEWHCADCLASYWASGVGLHHNRP